MLQTERTGISIHREKKKISENGFHIKDDFGNGKGEYWFFERYCCPRFTTPDENGKIILDYCFYIK